MLQALWDEHQDLMAGLAELDGDDDERAALLRKIHRDTDCAIADIVPQTLEECLIHARLLATVYCADSSWGREQDTRLAKSLLAGLEHLARRGQSPGAAEKTNGSDKGSAAADRNPLFSGIMDLEPPIHAARGAVETLFIMLDNEGEETRVGKSLGFVALALDRSVSSLQEQFDALHKAAKR